MAYPGPVYSRPREGRRWRRLWLPITVVVVAVLLLGGGAYAVVHHRDQQRQARARSVAQANAVAQRFLTAWGRNDTAAMAADVTPGTSGLITMRIPALHRSLQVVGASYRPGAVSIGNPPGAPFAADVTLRGLGHWRYDGRLPLEMVAGQWKVAFSPETIHPSLHGDDQLVRSRTLGTRGMLLLPDRVPLRGRDGELDGNMLGTVGKYTATTAAAAGPLYEAGDVGGLTGLERSYNAKLSGIPGGSLRITSGAGEVLTTLINQPRKDGQDVVLSFDLHAQNAAEQALAPLGPDQTGSLVAIDVATGRVLAVANHPYNGYGRALRGHYPPGSTFKVITTTAALMSGKTAATRLQCDPTISVDGRTFHNAEKESFGPIDLRTAFAKSCNTAFINLETTLPRGAVQTAARMYGFGATGPAKDTPTSGPLPLTSYGGTVPSPADAADAAAEAIGQGRITTSPLQMASVAAAVAAGTWRRPFVTEATPTGNPSHALPPRVAATLRGFMADVVASGTAATSGLPAGTVGKTGTGEVGSKSPPDTVAWFIGFRGRVAFACQVGGDTKSGGFGADTAAPAIARFLDGL